VVVVSAGVSVTAAAASSSAFFFNAARSVSYCSESSLAVVALTPESHNQSFVPVVVSANKLYTLPLT